MAGRAPDTLDIRPVDPQRTRPTVVAAYNKLAVGESFVLVDNRDPMLIRTVLNAQEAGAVGWQYLEAGPDVWRVRITRKRLI